MDAEILNVALDLRLSDNFSVNEKLQVLYPHLNEEEADNYRRECGLAMIYGETVAEKIYLKQLLPGQTGHTLMLERFPWLRSEKISRLLSRGEYSVWRNYGTDWGSIVVSALWLVAFVFSLFCLAWWL